MDPNLSSWYTGRDIACVLGTSSSASFAFKIIGIVIQVQQPQSPPDYNYKPNDYLILSIVMTVACTVFSPLALFLTIPAFMCSLKVTLYTP